jgi:hypothetical protein
MGSNMPSQETEANYRWFGIIWPTGVMGWDTMYVMQLKIHCFKPFYNFIYIIARLASFHPILT